MLAAALLGSSSVVSAQTTYFGEFTAPAAAARTSFQNALTAFAVNNLDGVTLNNPPIGDLAPFSLGAFGTATPSGGAVFRTAAYSTGNAILGEGPQSTVFTFSQFINGFGADWFDIGSASTFGEVQYQLWADNALVGTVGKSWGEVGAFFGQAFFGVTSTTSFNKVTVNVTYDGDFYEVDNITVGGQPGTTVPEPSTYALLAAGLLGLVVVKRRSQRT